MIKGVNKRIIEIPNPNDEYFEKVIIFLKPKVKDDLSVINNRAQNYLKSIKSQTNQNKKLKTILFVSQLAAAGMFGALVSIVCTTL